MAVMAVLAVAVEAARLVVLAEVAAVAAVMVQHLFGRGNYFKNKNGCLRWLTIQKHD
jgi:hypothetical protein